jgi:hypothetical protein
MSRTLWGSGGGMLVVLIGFLVLIFVGVSAVGASSAGAIFALTLLVFVFLAFFMLLGGGGRARVNW